LELASDLFLHEVHEIVQAAFGWTDYHLHQFASGPRQYGIEREYYLCPFSVDEGDEGVPEEEVRLDEVLVDVGDKLFYEYDFGDDWQHVIRLEAVLARESSAPRAICTGGRRPGPRKIAAASTATNCWSLPPIRTIPIMRQPAPNAPTPTGQTSIRMPGHRHRLISTRSTGHCQSSSLFEVGWLAATPGWPCCCNRNPGHPTHDHTSKQPRQTGPECFN